MLTISQTPQFREMELAENPVILFPVKHDNKHFISRRFSEKI